MYISCKIRCTDVLNLGWQVLSNEIIGLSQHKNGYSCDLELSACVVRGLDTIVVPVFTRLFLFRHKNVSADNIFLFTKKAASLLVRLPIFAA
jgi:hypothetical protein